MANDLKMKQILLFVFVINMEALMPMAYIFKLQQQQQQLVNWYSCRSIKKILDCCFFFSLYMHM